MIRVFGFGAGTPKNIAPETDPPQGLDWDLYCGPAPVRPFSTDIHPGNWRQYLTFGNGDLADWGVHWFDQILWWTEERYPRRIFSTGRRLRQDLRSDAPDTQVASFEFESFTLAWEHRRFAGNGAERHSSGIYFYGTEGTLHVGWRDGWTLYPANRNKPVLHEDAKMNLPDYQNIRELWADFLEAIRTGRKPVSDIENGHLATNLCLLGMLSLKLGRSLQWDGPRERVLNDPEANRSLTRVYRQPWEYPQA